MLRKIVWFFVCVGVLALIIGGAVATWGYYYVTRDLPQLSSVNDYRPSAVTKVYAADGTMIAEFYRERRYPAHINEIPLLIRNAFLAAEDAGFYNHPGIDPLSILRAAIKNLQAGSAKQGASTITQQVVKNLLLTPERKIERKVKEAILSYRLEEALSKDEIFEIYLNQIFLGNNAYGVKAAGLAYYHKNLEDLTLAEASMLAGLPKAPSKFSPLLNLPRAKRRQKYVLTQMVKAGFVTQNDADKAYDEKIKFYPYSAQNVYGAPYFVSEIRRVFQDRWKDYDLEADGLEIFTTVDLKATKLAEDSLKSGLRDVDKRRGWRGPIDFIAGAHLQEFNAKWGWLIPEELEFDEVYPALVTEFHKGKGTVKVAFGTHTATVDLRAPNWSRRKLEKDDRSYGASPEDFVKVGSVIEISFAQKEKEKEEEKEKEKIGGVARLDQTPEIEGATSLIDPNSGRVAALIGGYSYQRSVFNRATQSLRQPGSTFKPLVYLSAVDGYKYTPATIVHDSPKTLRVGDQYWAPANYDEKYLGPITLRTALERSRNLVSVDIVSRIGITPVIKYARLLGITTPIGRNPSIALGSAEVTLLELVRAYGVFAARGVLFDTYMINKIVDRTGAVVYDHENETLSSAKQVVSPQSAFVMAHMMKGVIQSGTATVIKPINRPVAGKTGTTNDMMDAWFIGYTPQWVCGVWVGFDAKRTIGDKETGGKVAAPIWLHFMQPYLDYLDQIEYDKLVQETKSEAERLGIEYRAPEKLAPLDFQPPDGVEGMWVNKGTGRPVSGPEEGAIYEYFIKGTEPQQISPEEQEGVVSYLESPEL